MANRFWVGGTGNWNDNTHWGTTTGASFPVGAGVVPVAADVAIFDGSSGGGTVTVNVTPSILGLTTSAFTGTLDFGASGITLQGTGATYWIDAGTGAHTINMGSGTWAINCTSNPGQTLMSISGASMTLTPGTATITIAGPNGSIRLGTKTYNAMSLGAGQWAFDASNGTIGTLTASPGAAMLIASGIVVTVTNAPTFVGTRAAPILIGTSVAAGAVGTLTATSGTPTLDWGILQRSTVTASGTATNTVTYGTNTGWGTPSGPSAGGSAGVIGG